MNHGEAVSSAGYQRQRTLSVAESGAPSWSVWPPVQAADKPAAPAPPVLCTSWSEAVEKLGFRRLGNLTRSANSCIRTSSCSPASLSFSAMFWISPPQRRRLPRLMLR